MQDVDLQQSKINQVWGYHETTNDSTTLGIIQIQSKYDYPTGTDAQVSRIG